MGTLKEMFRDLVKTGLCWLGYKNRAGLATAAVRGAEAAYYHSATQALGKNLKERWEKSQAAMRRAIRWLVVGILAGLVVGLIGLFPVEHRTAEAIRYVGGLVFIAPAALFFLTALWQLAQFQVLDELIIFALLTARRGYETAVELLPDFIGKNLTKIIDPVIAPLVFEAKRISNLVWSIFIGAGSLALFAFVFKIHQNPSWFFAIIVAGAVLVGWVIRYRPETDLLRPAAFGMSVATLVIAGVVSIAPSLASKGSVREDCIRQYYFYGSPTDKVLASQCKSDVEPEIMSNLTRFNELKGKKLSQQEKVEFDALDTVIKGVLEGKPKPLVVAEPPAPRMAPTVAATADVKPTPKPKPSAAATQRAAEKNEILARMQERQKKINDLLGKKQ